MATATVNYGSTTDSTALSITLDALPSSATLVAGRQSAVVSNVSNKYLDVSVFGQITVASSGLSAGLIAIYVFAPTKFASSSWNYPIAGSTELGESDAAATFDVEQRAALRLGDSIATNTTGSRKYNLRFNVAPLFGGFVPTKFGIWVTHSTGQNLASATNWLHYLGHKVDSA